MSCCAGRSKHRPGVGKFAELGKLYDPAWQSSLSRGAGVLVYSTYYRDDYSYAAAISDEDAFALIIDIVSITTVRGKAAFLLIKSIRIETGVLQGLAAFDRRCHPCLRAPFVAFGA